MTARIPPTPSLMRLAEALREAADAFERAGAARDRGDLRLADAILRQACQASERVAETSEGITW